MRKIEAVAGFVFIFCAFSPAQIPTGGNVFFGYSYSRGNAFTKDVPPPPSPRDPGLNLNGWEASVEGKYLPWIGLVADLDWHYGSHSVSPACVPPGCTRPAIHLNASRHQLMFGPRVSVSVGKYTPFAHLLIGVAHQSDSGANISNSDTTFATAIGGGLDYKLIKAVAARVQLDSVHTNFFDIGQNDLRFSMGIVFKF